jgi:hypothetical protein
MAGTSKFIRRNVSRFRHRSPCSFVCCAQIVAGQRIPA